MFNQLQQDKDCDKIERKSNEEKGGLDEVGRMKEIQPEQYIEEAENLMSEDVEV